MSAPKQFWRAHDDDGDAELIGPIIVPSKKKDTARKFPILNAPELAIAEILMKILDDELTKTGSYYSAIEEMNKYCTPPLAVTPGFERFGDEKNLDTQRLRSGLFEMSFQRWFSKLCPGLENHYEILYLLSEKHAKKKGHEYSAGKYAPNLTKFQYEQFFIDTWWNLQKLADFCGFVFGTKKEPMLQGHPTLQEYQRVVFRDMDTRDDGSLRVPAGRQAKVAVAILFHLTPTLRYTIPADERVPQGASRQIATTGADIVRFIFRRLFSTDFDHRWLNPDGTILDHRKIYTVILDDKETEVMEKRLAVVYKDSLKQTNSLSLAERQLSAICGAPTGETWEAERFCDPQIPYSRALRNALFEYIFDSTFSSICPRLRNEYKHLYGVHIIEFQESDLSYNFEEFFADAWTGLEAIRSTRRDEQDFVYLFGKTVPVTGSWLSKRVGCVYGAVLHFMEEEIDYIISRDAEKFGRATGSQLARLALRRMLANGSYVANLLYYDGTIFDGREIYTVIAEEGFGFELFVSGAHAELQVRRAFEQNPTSPVWLHLLRTLPLKINQPWLGGEWPPPYLELETFCYLFQQLVLSSPMQREEAIKFARQFLAIIIGGYNETVIYGSTVLSFLVDNADDLTATEIFVLMKKLHSRYNTADTTIVDKMFEKNPNLNIWFSVATNPTVEFGDVESVVKAIYDNKANSWTYAQFKSFVESAIAKYPPSLLAVPSGSLSWLLKVQEIPESQWAARPTVAEMKPRGFIFGVTPRPLRLFPRQ
jgi:hypothetical protein